MLNTNQYTTNRLYCKGRILGHKRGKRNSRPNQSLVQIEGVDTAENARAYLGKVSWIYCGRGLVGVSGLVLFDENVGIWWTRSDEASG